VRRSILLYLSRVPILYEELNSLTFHDHARNFSHTTLTCNSYFSLHFSRLLLPYTDSLCCHYHILNHWEWKGTEAWRKQQTELSALTLTSSYFALKRRQKLPFSFASYQNSLTTNKFPRLSLTKLIPWLSRRVGTMLSTSQYIACYGPGPRTDLSQYITGVACYGSMACMRVVPQITYKTTSFC